MRVLKAFVDRAEMPALLEHAELVERYPAFVVVKAEDGTAAALAQQFPVEDITSLYPLQFGNRTIDTMRPAARQRRASGPSTLPHHYVVQFIGPIKKTWLAGVRATGAKLRAPFGGLGYIVRASAAQLEKIA